MMQLKTLLRGLLLVAALCCAPGSLTWSSESKPAVPSELAAYVARPDASFKLREMTSGRVGNADYIEYLMTSQTWRSIEWKHQLFVLRPANMTRDSRHALLFIHGGRWKAEYEASRSAAELPREAMLFARLAEAIRAPVAVVRQVPFQPMFELREDALIAHTFGQYLQTGDADWPLLLPMVKSATRAMDAVQDIVRQRWGASPEFFTVSGASKRGWTAWLTAATDQRVMAVAPMVIDVLNMRVQMAHQRATWGELSNEIRDYSALDLPKQLETPRGEALLSIVDPFAYRPRLTQPKLILLSTNDRYWPLDALKLYWRELPDPKHVLYVPNQGHDLSDVDRVIGGLSAVHRYAATSKPLPATTWSFAPGNDALNVEIKVVRPAERVLMWSAHSLTRDFRESRWTARKCSGTGNRHTCSAQRREKGYTAAYAETTFRDKDYPAFSTTTTVCIAAAKPSTPADC